VTMTLFILLVFLVVGRDILDKNMTIDNSY